MYYLRQFETTPLNIVWIIPKIGIVEENAEFVLELRHIATNKIYYFTTTTADYNTNSFLIVTRFDEIPYLGQYDFVLIKDGETPVVYYKTLLEVVHPKKEIPQNNNITILSQFNG